MKLWESFKQSCHAQDPFWKSSEGNPFNEAFVCLREHRELEKIGRRSVNFQHVAQLLTAAVPFLYLIFSDVISPFVYLVVYGLLAVYALGGIGRRGKISNEDSTPLPRTLALALFQPKQHTRLLLDFWMTGHGGRALCEGSYREAVDTTWRTIVTLTLVLIGTAGAALLWRGLLVHWTHFVFLLGIIFFIVTSMSLFLRYPWVTLASNIKMTISRWQNSEKFLFKKIAIAMAIGFGTVLLLSPLAVGIIVAMLWLRKNSVGSWAEPFLYYQKGMFGLIGALIMVGLSVLLEAIYRTIAMKRLTTTEEQLSKADALFDTFMREVVLEDPDARLGALPYNPAQAPTSS